MIPQRYADKSQENKILETILYTRYKDIAISRFQWKNLPDGLTSEFIEKGLFEHGKMLACMDKNLGFLILECNPSNQVNVYGEWTHYRAWGYGYEKEFSMEDSVLIRNNVDCKPTSIIVQYYLRKMAEIDNVCDVNVISHATPYIIQGKKNNILSLKGMWNKIKNLEPVVITDKKFMPDDLTVHKTDSPYVIDKLCDYYTTLENRLLTTLGFNNLASDKKERLLTDEVNSNNEIIEQYLEQQFEYRKKAVEEINEKFGLDIEVELLVTREEMESFDLSSDSETDTRRRDSDI